MRLTLVSMWAALHLFKSKDVLELFNFNYHLNRLEKKVSSLVALSAPGNAGADELIAGSVIGSD